MKQERQIQVMFRPYLPGSKLGICCCDEEPMKALKQENLGGFPLRWATPDTSVVGEWI